MSWAERGIEGARDARDLSDVDTALVDYLCDRYAQAGRPADAVALRRDHFGARRTLLAYQQLRAAARAADCWPAEREGALALLRTDARQWQLGWYGGPVLVDALLDDKDGAAAWQAAAQTGAHDRLGVPPPGEAHPADEARATRPADALCVYLRPGRTADQVHRQHGLRVDRRPLLSVRDVHRRLGAEDAFAV